MIAAPSVEGEELEGKELVKREAKSGLVQRLLRVGAVDPIQGRLPFDQPFLGNQPFGQRIIDIRELIERLPHQRSQEQLGDAGGKGVDRNRSPSVAANGAIAAAGRRRTSPAIPTAEVPPCW